MIIQEIMIDLRRWYTHYSQGGSTVAIPKSVYFKGEIVPYADAKIGVMTHALNYGTAVFGGIRGYWNDDEEQLYLFRPRDHFRRFLHSCKIMVIEFDQNPETLTQLTLDLMRAMDITKMSTSAHLHTKPMKPSGLNSMA